jgi:hypothetical protein
MTDPTTERFGTTLPDDPTDLATWIDVVSGRTGSVVLNAPGG